MEVARKHVRVDFADLGPERLDTGFYSAEYFAARAALERSGITSRTIGSLCDPWSFGAYALTNEIEWTRDRDGIPFFKAESLGSPLVEESGLSFITEETHSKLAKSSVRPGDIIVSTSGTIGKVAVVPASMPRANSNQDTIKFNPGDPLVDNYFLAAQLCSKYGQALLHREAGGGVQQHVYLYNFKRIPLALPSKEAQAYVGNKVRQAEALRARAGENQAEVNLAIERILGEASNRIAQVSRDHSRLPASHLTERLDARFYSPEYLAWEELFSARDTVPLESLSLRVECGPFGGNAIAGGLYELDGIPFLRPLNVTGNRFDGTQLALVPEQSLTRNRLKIYDGECLLFGRVGNPCVGLFHGRFSISPNLVLAQIDSNAADAAYLHAYCSSRVGLHQLERQLKEVAQPTTPTDGVRELRVILPERAEQDRIGRLNREIDRFTRWATSLTTAARFLVEALIEHTVTEQDLISAHRDPAVDYALLRRLTAQGLDVQGRVPLFPDLDALLTQSRMEGGCA